MTAQELKIVSLVPSLTETLCDLGLQNFIVGCTSFCVHPKTLRKTTTNIGGTKDASAQKIKELNPTHVVVNTEENPPHLIQEIKELLPNTTVLETFPTTVFESIECVKYLAQVFSVKEKFYTWEKKVNDYLIKINSPMIPQTKNVNEKKNKPSISFCYFIWRAPWMVAGNHSYISHLLELGGFKNNIQTSKIITERYPNIEPTDNRILSSDILLFSSEPFPFKKRHIEELYVASGINFEKCLLVDGQNLSWYGTRTLQGLQTCYELKKLLCKN